MAEFWFLVKFWKFLDKNRKFEILNPSRNPNFGSLTLNPNFQFWQILDYLLNLVLPNLDRSRRQLSNDTKIVKFGQNLVQKFLISQILWVLGSTSASRRRLESIVTAANLKYFEIWRTNKIKFHESGRRLDFRWLVRMSFFRARIVRFFITKFVVEDLAWTYFYAEI